MEIIKMPISALKEYENNPRLNDEAVEYVARSIEEFGFKNPIIVDSENVIIAGHTRLKAAKFLELEEVPVIVADDLTEDQVRAFRLADNKVAELAKWDYTLLAEELDVIDIDMGEFGFIELSDIDLEDFFEDAEPSEDPDPEEEEKEIQCPHCKMYFKVD
jgi:ParB-like chromosome segregation protein Spo0J